MAFQDDGTKEAERAFRLGEAVRLIGEHVRPVAGAETVRLARADGRVLARPITAGRDLPPFDNAAVDGYAVRSGDLAASGPTTLPVAGRGPAGHPAEAPAGAVAYRIFTGAPMPPGFDTVAMQEAVSVGADGHARLPADLRPGANRRRAGEDVAAGATILPAGRRLSPADIGLLAALGIDAVAVRRPLRVAVASTGDELAGAGDAIGPAGRFDANRPMLLACLGRLGMAATDRGIWPDRRDAVEAALREAAAGHDLVLTSGGVSVGEEDHLRDAVAAAGELSLWRLAIKPGRPVALGTVGGARFLGLPGNPVSAFLCFALLGRPLLAALGGETYLPPLPLPVRAGFAHAKRPGRREFLRVLLSRNEDGAVTASKHPRDGSGMITSLTGSDGIVDLSEDRGGVEPGDTLDYLPFAALL